MIQFAHVLLLVLVTGIVADHFDRRLIVGLAALVETACAVAMLALTFHIRANPLPIFIMLVVFDIAHAFFGPA